MLHHLNKNKYRNLYKFRQSNVNIISSANTKDTSTEGATDKTDRFFKRKLSKNVFQNFVKHGGVPSSKTSISELMRFDEIVTDFINELIQSTCVNGDGEE